MATQPINRPIPGVLYGITHETNGDLIIREPKILKVGIGLPKGPALNVWIAPDGKWKVRFGYKNDEAKTATLSTRKAAEDLFHDKLASAPVCPFPRKIGYFTFSKPSIDDSGKEQFLPDFDAIEAHGPTPTEIDIVLLDDDPFAGAYQMWSSSELRCKGDGINAMRLVTMATGDEKPAAQLAIEAGEKYFAIGGCWTEGCPYSKETTRNGKPQPSACKPGGDLKFQLASNIRVGGTAYLHTTGFRSISSIFSSLHRISALTGGRLSGIPLKMVLRPFKTNHNGQSATQYAVALEFRAPDVATLRQKLLETVFEYRAAAGITAPAQHTRAIEAPVVDAVTDVEDDDPPIGAEAMAAEFYPEATDEPEVDGATTAPAASAPIAAATEEKTAGLAEKMKASAGRTRQAPLTAQPVVQPIVQPIVQPTAQAQAQPAGPTPIPGDMF